MNANEWLIGETGEVVDLDDPVAVVNALRSLRDRRNAGYLDERRLTDALVAEMERRAAGKTLEINGDWKVVMSGGKKTEWDAERLRVGLEQAGMAPGRLGEIVKTKLEVSAREAGKAASVNEEYAFIVDGCKTEVEASWRADIRKA